MWHNNPSYFILRDEIAWVWVSKILNLRIYQTHIDRKFLVGITYLPIFIFSFDKLSYKKGPIHLVVSKMFFF